MITTTLRGVEPDLEKRLHRAAEGMTRAKRVRDAAILDAYLTGAPLREIARAVDMTHPGVKAVIDRFEENPKLLAEHIRRRDGFQRMLKNKRMTEEEWREQRGR